MNFNNDVSKIPITPSYPIPGISDLVDELPHPGTHPPSHPMQHGDSRHEAATRILNTPDAALVSQIVDAFASNPVDHMNQQRDTSMDNVNPSLFQAVMARNPDVYPRNMAHPGMNVNMPHIGQYQQHPQNIVACSVPSFPHTNDAVTSARATPLGGGNPSRPVVKPVQAVAPQPRHPRQLEKMNVDANPKQVFCQEKGPHERDVSRPIVEAAHAEENPKICLKIRRTKKNKGNKEKKHHNEPVEYGIVSSQSTSRDQHAGPIKLKLTRVKTPGSAESSTKANDNDQAFKISSVTGGAGHKDEQMRSGMSTDVAGQKHAEEAAAAMARAIFNTPQSADHPPKAKPPKMEKVHKQKPHMGEPHLHPNYLEARMMPARVPDTGASKNFTGASVMRPDVAHDMANRGMRQQSHSHIPDSRAHSTPHSGNKPNRHHSAQHPGGFFNADAGAMPPYHQSMQHQRSRVPAPSNFGSPALTPQQVAQQYPYVNSGTAFYNKNMPQNRMMPHQAYPSPYRPNQSRPQQVNAPYMRDQAWGDPRHRGHPQGHHIQTSMHHAPSKPPPYTEAMGLQVQSTGDGRLSQPAFYQQEQQAAMQRHVEQPGMHQHLSKPLVPKHAEQAVMQQQMQQPSNFIAHNQMHMDVRMSDATQMKMDVQHGIPGQVNADNFQMHPHFSGKANMPTQQWNHPNAPHQQHQVSHHPMSESRSMGNSSNYANYCNAPQPSTTPNQHNRRRNTSQSNISQGDKTRKKGAQHVRVKFIADDEEADIYKLKDIMYPDDTEVSSFDELQPGADVVAKWPMNGKLYAAVVIDPLDNTGRRFRERKPPPKPFQASSDASRKDRKAGNQPSVVLDKLDLSALPDMKLSRSYERMFGSNDFGAYTSMADRIKDKKRRRMAAEMKGKKRKRGSSESPSHNLINMQSDESDDDERIRSPNRKRSHLEEMRKQERRRAVVSRLQQEDGSGLFRRLTTTIGSIFDDMDSIDPRILDDFTGRESTEHQIDVPQCLLVSRSRLQDLSSELAKLKALGHLIEIPKKQLVRLLTILEPNIRDGVRLRPMKLQGHSSEEQKWNRDCQLDRVTSSTEAALAAMHVMTAPYMPKAVYIDDVMERGAMLLKQQLNNTIYPEYDPVYRNPSTVGKKKGSKEMASTASTRMKRAHYKGPKNRTILQLYNKLNILLSLWEELVTLQPLTDTTVLQISSVGISPFFVENVRELQLSAIRLTTAIFSRYDKHRSLILEDIFQSLARLPTSKRNLRSYRLTYADETVDSSDEEDGGGKAASSELQYIQMVSALVLQMVHAICQLPVPEPPSNTDGEATIDAKEVQLQHQVDELKIITSYDIAARTGQNFLSVFLKKCASKSEEIDYRPLFENLVHDLLATVNKPEWPASEMLLSLLGRLLVHTFSTKSTEMSLRVAALDYLGVVAAKLRHDAITGHSDAGSIKSLMQRLEETLTKEEEPIAEEAGTKDNDEKTGTSSDVKQIPVKGRVVASAKPKKTRKRKTNKKKKQSKTSESEEEMLTRQLQYLLLAYLRRNAGADPSLLFAHNFYIGQWLRDISLEFQQLQAKETDDVDAQSRKLQTCQRKKDALLELSSSAAVAVAAMKKEQNQDSTETMRRLPPSEEQMKADKLAAGLTVEDAALVTRHLTSSRPFSRAFDCYLSYILRVREESAVALRTRAIKCLAEVVAVDPSIMEREDIAQGVQASLVDASTSVREAAIDLVGKFILLKPDLVKHYYEMLTARILDTGVSVRKRVIRILRDLCHEYPELPQLTDACVKMIRRVNDEEGIKKLVHEVFMKMWFTPVDPQDTNSLRKKALLITDIVAANRERGYEWIEQLFKNLIDTPVQNPQVEIACKQIVDCLVQHVILFDKQNGSGSENASSSNENAPSSNENASSSNENASSSNENASSSNENASSSNENASSSNENASSSNETLNDATKPAVQAVAASAPKSKERSIRLVATIQTLVQLARIRPRLLVPHVMTLQPYLATKCEVPDDASTVHGVCRVLELAVPLMEHPSDAFLASIEEDMTRLILLHRFHVVAGAVACLGAITCRVTHNYRLIWDCFQRMCYGLSNARSMHQKQSESIFQTMHFKKLLRTLFIIGHFCKNFDFDQEILKGKAQVCVKDKVYECIYYFAKLATTRQTEELKGFSVKALGLLMIQDPNMMFRSTTRELYGDLLDPSQESERLKKQVLQNLQNYLQTEDVKMQEAAEASAKKAKQEGDESSHLVDHSVSEETTTEDDIKEICDVSSGMASSVMQLFLKQVLECFFHRHVMVRHAALHTVFLTLQQGLVHPVQCVPYLVAAASDPEAIVHKEADQQLTELSKRYSGFIHTKALQGLKLSYRAQSYIQPAGKAIRGYIETSMVGFDESVGTSRASCSHLYQLMRSDRKHRRAFLLCLLKMFDDTVKTELGMLVFVADNLAHFPYATLDEPLFLMSQIDVYVSVSGSNVLQTFKEALHPKRTKKEMKRRARQAKLEEKARKRKEKEERDEEASHSSSSSSSGSSSSSESSSSEEEEDASDEEDAGLLSRLPDNDEAVKEFAHLSLACLLLLWVKQHIKSMYGITDNKIHKYTPNEVNRANDKQCHRRRGDAKFEPTRALQHLDRMRRGIPCKHPEYQQAVVTQYAEFNELMNKLDPNDDDSDSEKEKKTPAKNVTLSSSVAETSLKENDDEESDRDTDDESKPPAALAAIRQATALKSKKSHKKQKDSGAPPEMRKRRTVQYIESSSSDSEEEFHGF